MRGTSRSHERPNSAMNPAPEITPAVARAQRAITEGTAVPAVGDRGSAVRWQARELSSRAFLEEVGNERRTSRVAATVTSEERYLPRMQTAPSVPRRDRSSLSLVVPEQPVRWSLQVSAQALALVRVLLVQVQAPR